ncbi:bifunctional 3-(3-hydroxy-phenyl)propionate/3-hydroxycinnamic acid hydroxylase [Leifsonia shinshuensis]
MGAGRDYDVVVVGAGPTGLALAILLAGQGVSTAVVEAHQSIYPLPRAVHLDAEVYRILHTLGVGTGFAAISRPAAGLRLVDGRHRRLAQFDRLDVAGALPEANLFDQPDLEALLRARAEAAELIDLMLGVAVCDLASGSAGVTVTTTDRRTGEEATLRASYVVGADGANSTVRELLEIPVDNLGFAQRWLVADLRVDRELDAWGGVHQICDVDRPGTFMRVGADRYRWEFRLLDGESAARFSSIPALRELVDRWIHDLPDSDVQVVRIAEYMFKAQVARQWRMGRVLLAGDAAHLTPPFIGQGLGSGLRDSMNLGWKLARVVTGRSEDSLLSSYETERKPHAVALIRKAMMIGRVMTGREPSSVLGRRVAMPIASHIPPLGQRLLSSTTPALAAGDAIDATTPKRLRGTILPPVRVTDPRTGEVRWIDEVLPFDFAVISRGDPVSGVEAGAVNLRVDPSSSVAGERELAVWLSKSRCDWAVVRPDRVISMAGRGKHPGHFGVEMSDRSVSAETEEEKDHA